MFYHVYLARLSFRRMLPVHDVKADGRAQPEPAAFLHIELTLKYYHKVLAVYLDASTVYNRSLSCSHVITISRKYSNYRPIQYTGVIIIISIIIISLLLHENASYSSVNRYIGHVPTKERSYSRLEL